MENSCMYLIWLENPVIFSHSFPYDLMPCSYMPFSYIATWASFRSSICWASQVTRADPRTDPKGWRSPPLEGWGAYMYFFFQLHDLYMPYAFFCVRERRDYIITRNISKWESLFLPIAQAESRILNSDPRPSLKEKKGHQISRGKWIIVGDVFLKLGNLIRFRYPAEYLHNHHEKAKRAVPNTSSLAMAYWCILYQLIQIPSFTRVSYISR